MHGSYKRILGIFMTVMMILSTGGIFVSFFDIPDTAYAKVEVQTDGNAAAGQNESGSASDATGTKESSPQKGAVNEDPSGEVKGSAEPSAKQTDSTEAKTESTEVKEEQAEEPEVNEVVDEPDNTTAVVEEDTSVARKIKASDGRIYRVTATFGSNTGIPADARLSVEEVKPDDNRYAKLAKKSDKAIGKYEDEKAEENGDNDKDDKTGVITMAQPDLIFDIKLIGKNGAEYQPDDGSGVEIAITPLMSKEEKEVFADAYDVYAKAEKSNVARKKLLRKKDKSAAENNAEELLELAEQTSPVVHLKDNGNTEVLEGSTEVSEEGIEFAFQTDSFSYFRIRKSDYLGIFSENMDIYTFLGHESGTGSYRTIDLGNNGDIVKSYASILRQEHSVGEISDAYLSYYNISNKYKLENAYYVDNTYRESYSSIPADNIVSDLNQGNDILKGTLTHYISPIASGAVTNWRGAVKNSSNEVRLSGPDMTVVGDPLYLAVMMYEERLTYLTVTNDSVATITINSVQLTGNNRNPRYKNTDHAFVFENESTPTLEQLRGVELTDLSTWGNHVLQPGASVTFVVPTAHGDGYKVNYSAAGKTDTLIYRQSGFVNDSASKANGVKANTGGTVNSGSYSLAADKSQNIIFEDAIARVSNDGGNTWTYHAFLDNPEEKAHEKGVKKGAFDQANSYASGNVIIELLKEGDADGTGNNDETKFGNEDYGRYTLIRQFTFDKAASIELRTTKDDKWNPDGFTSIITRGFDDNSKSLINLNNQNVTLATSNVTFTGIMRDTQKTGRAFSSEKGTLTINSGTTIQDFKVPRDGAAAYLGSADAKLIINDGTITECTTTNGSGGAVAVGAGTMTMSGGTIQKCAAVGTSASGGAVVVGNGGTFNMTGGTIRKNTAGDKGGAVMVMGSGIVNMSGGLITDNASDNGGAVNVENTNARLNFTGNPKITENSDGLDVYVDFDSNDVINATRMGDDASIGIYVVDGEHYFDEHGEDGDPFGTYTSPEGNLSVFVNTRTGSVAEKSLETGSNHIIWKLPKRTPVIVRKEWKNIQGHADMKQDVEFTVVGEYEDEDATRRTVDLVAYAGQTGGTTVSKLTSDDYQRDPENHDIWEREVWVNTTAKIGGNTVSFVDDGSTEFHYNIKEDEDKLDGSWTVTYGINTDTDGRSIGPRTTGGSSTGTWVIENEWDKYNNVGDKYAAIVIRSKQKITNIKTIQIEFTNGDDTKYVIECNLNNLTIEKFEEKNSWLVSWWYEYQYSFIIQTPDLPRDYQLDSIDVIRYTRVNNNAADMKPVLYYFNIFRGGSEEEVNGKVPRKEVGQYLGILIDVTSLDRTGYLTNYKITKMIKNQEPDFTKPVLRITNTYIPGRRKVILRKVRKNSYAPLDERSFKIYRKGRAHTAANVIAEGESQESGVIWIGTLNYGDYEVVENEGSSSEHTFYIKVNNNGATPREVSYTD